MVRLSLAAGPGAPWQYAREEVLGRSMIRSVRRWPRWPRWALAPPAKSPRLRAARSPSMTLPGRFLWSVLDDGRYRAHDLWAEAVPRIITVRTCIPCGNAPSRSSQPGRPGPRRSAGLPGGDWRLLAILPSTSSHDAVRAAVHPRGEMAWRGPASGHGQPGVRAAAGRGLARPHFLDPRIDPMLDRAWHEMLNRRDQRGAAAVLGQAMITAHSRADLARLAVVAEWGDRLDGPVSPVVTLLRHNVAAMRAEVGGDPEAALAEFAEAPTHEVPRALALSSGDFTSTA